jgi:hypothetical protein
MLTPADGVRAAKGSIRKEITHAINQQLVKFHLSECDCKAESLLAFVGALYRTGVWPCEDNARSIEDIRTGLENFCYVPPENACEQCSEDLRSDLIDEIIEQSGSYFQGLCLDCFADGKAKAGREGNAPLSGHDFSSGCRVEHGRNTWYYSDMGSAEEKKEYVYGRSGRGSGRKRQSGFSMNRSFYQDSPRVAKRSRRSELVQPGRHSTNRGNKRKRESNSADGFSPYQASSRITKRPRRSKAFQNLKQQEANLAKYVSQETAFDEHMNEHNGGAGGDDDMNWEDEDTIH